MSPGGAAQTGRWVRTPLQQLGDQLPSPSGAAGLLLTYTLSPPSPQPSLCSSPRESMVPLHWRQLGHSSKTRWERRWEGGHSVLVWVGQGSGLHILKELLLVVQEELGKSIDGVDGF